jgi:hypothetical protein
MLQLTSEFQTLFFRFLKDLHSLVVVINPTLLLKMCCGDRGLAEMLDDVFE